MEARKSCTQLLKLHNSQPYNEEHIYYLLWMLRCLLGLPHCLYSLSHVLYCLDFDIPSVPNKPLERIQWYNRIGKVKPSFENMTPSAMFRKCHMPSLLKNLCITLTTIEVFQAIFCFYISLNVDDPIVIFSSSSNSYLIEQVK